MLTHVNQSPSACHSLGERNHHHALSDNIRLTSLPEQSQPLHVHVYVFVPSLLPLSTILSYVALHNFHFNFFNCLNYCR